MSIIERRSSEPRPDTPQDRGEQSPHGGAARVPDDWFDGFHDGLVARFWRAAGASMQEADVALVHALLGLAPGARVLDAPCGDGRIARGLAARGLHVTGVDIAAAEVELARRMAARAGLTTATFVTGDLRDLPAVGPVDAVVSWGNSFGYLDPGASARSLARMRELLRPGGVLVLESMTIAESLLVGGLAADDEWEFGGIRMAARNHYRAEESRLESRFTLTSEDGSVQVAHAAHHVHTSGELVRMLCAAGFARVELLGADGRTPYEPGSPRLIARASA